VTASTHLCLQYFYRSKIHTVSEGSKEQEGHKAANHFFLYTQMEFFVTQTTIPSYRKYQNDFTTYERF